MLRRFWRQPQPQTAAQTAEEAQIAELLTELLTELGRIPRDELPDGAARDALVEAIRCGEVDGLYRPVARTYHNVTLAHLPRDVDPRITVAQWAQWWQGGKSPSDELLAESRRRRRDEGER